MIGSGLKTSDNCSERKISSIVKILLLAGTLLCLFTTAAASDTIYLSRFGSSDWNLIGCTAAVPCKPTSTLQLFSVDLVIYIFDDSFSSTATLELHGSSTVAIRPALARSSFDTLSWSFSCVDCLASAGVSFLGSTATNSNISFTHIPNATIAGASFDDVHVTYTNTSTLAISNTRWMHYDADPALTHVSLALIPISDIYSLVFENTSIQCVNTSDCGTVLQLNLLVASPYPFNFLIQKSRFTGNFSTFSALEGAARITHKSNYTILQSTIAVSGIARPSRPLFGVVATVYEPSFFRISASVVNSSSAQDFTDSNAPNIEIESSTLSGVLLTSSLVPAITQFRGSVLTGACGLSIVSSTFVCQGSTVHCGTDAVRLTAVLLRDAQLQVSNCAFSGTVTSSLVLHNSTVSPIAPRSSLPSGASSPPDLLIDQLGVVFNASVAALMEIRSKIIGLEYSVSVGYVAATSDMTLYGDSSSVLVSGAPLPQNYFWRLHGSLGVTNVVLREISHLQFDLGNGGLAPLSLFMATLPFLSSLSTGQYPDIAFTWDPGFAPVDEQKYHFLTSSTMPILFLPTWYSPLTLPKSSSLTYSFNISATDSSKRREILNSSSTSLVAVMDLYYSARSTSCPLPAPLPLTAWKCVGQQWVSNGDIGGSGTVVVVGSPVIVAGNFSAPVVTFNGLNSTIQVLGCASMPSQISVTLTLSEYLLLRKNATLYALLIESNCTDSQGQQVTISVQATNKKSCEKIQGTLLSDGQTMTATFRLSSSGCKTWWIILVAVLCSVAFVIIVLALIFTLVPRARHLVRPYSKRNAA